MATLLFTENFFNVLDCNMFCFSFLNRIFFVIRYYYIHRLQIKKERKDRKKERKKESTKFKKCTSMASTNCYTVNIHSYRFCVSYIGFSVSRVGPTCTAYSIFILVGLLALMMTIILYPNLTCSLILHFLIRYRYPLKNYHN